MSSSVLEASGCRFGYLYKYSAEERREEEAFYAVVVPIICILHLIICIPLVSCSFFSLFSHFCGEVEDSMWDIGSWHVDRLPREGAYAKRRESRSRPGREGLSRGSPFKAGRWIER